MKATFKRLLSAARLHLPTVLAMFVSGLLFLLLANMFIEEKSFLSKLFAPAAGFFGGLIGGGVLGWIVGGFGVVAMGGAIGVSAFGAILLGGVIGAILGGLGGTAFSFIQFVLNPSDYNANLPALGLLAIGTVGLFLPLRWGFRKLPSFTERLVRRNGGASDESNL